MNFVCGIYGYHITSPINLTDHNLRIEPITNDYKVAKSRADDHKSYQLTATLTGKSRDDLFYLEAILSFIEGRDVLITSPKDLTNGESPSSQLAMCINMPVRGKASNKAIQCSKHNSRISFIINALNRLNHEDKLKKDLCEDGSKNLSNIPLFNALFFKYVESFRQNTFPEIGYYLLFSGLEAFCTNWAESQGLLNPDPKKPFCSTCGYLIPKEELKKCPDCVNLQQKVPNHKSASDVINRFLKKYGDLFGATDNLKSGGNKYAAMAAYACLRNKLVHENKFTTTIKDSNKETVTLDLFDFKTNLEILVMLVILKEVSFADDDTNYNSWLS